MLFGFPSESAFSFTGIPTKQETILGIELRRHI